MKLKTKPKTDVVVCPVCHKGGFELMPLLPGQTKPTFKCGVCESTWQWGYDGGDYMKEIERRKVND